MVYDRSKDRRITVDMTKEMYQDFDAICKEAGIKQSAGFREAIALYIKKHTKKPTSKP